MRVAVLGNHPGRATGRIDGVLSAFGVVRAPAQHLTRRRCTVAPGDLRYDRGDLLSAGELATLAGLPSASILEASRARVVAAGPEVPAKGMKLGVSVGRPVAIAFPDVLYHAHVIGPTGVGKTTLLTNMALDLLAAGWSLVTADIAKGDLVDWILARLPESMVGRVSVIDPTAESVPGLNVLATDNPVLTADQLVGTFSRLYSSAWGPHLEQVLRQAFLTLAYGGGTLVELELLLTDESFRSKMVGKVLADAGRGRASYAMAKLEGYWDEFDSKTDRERARLLDPVLYKLDGFIPASVAAIIGQVSPKGDPLSVVDEGGSVFVRAPAGEVGDDPARLLASLLAIRNWQRLQARSAVPEDERPRLQRVAFLADEAQDMFGSRAKGQGEVAERMLVQARGLGGAFIVGHQHLAQLTPDFAKALGTNATTKVLFRLDEDDAKKFASRVSPEFREQDLMALEFGQAVCKPCIDRGQGAAFTFRTRAPTPRRPVPPRGCQGGICTTLGPSPGRGGGGDGGPPPGSPPGRAMTTRVRVPVNGWTSICSLVDGVVGGVVGGHGELEIPSQGSGDRCKRRFMRGLARCNRPGLRPLQLAASPKRAKIRPLACFCSSASASGPIFDSSPAPRSAGSWPPAWLPALLPHPCGAPSTCSPEAPR